MNSYTSPLSAGPAPYAATVPYSMPAYAPSGLSGPIPLTPLVMPDITDAFVAEEEESSLGFGFFSLKKLAALPLLLLLPLIAVVVVVVIAVVVVVVIPVVFPNFSKRFFAPQNEYPTEKPYPYEEVPYNASNGDYSSPYPQKRRRREAEKEKEASSGLPAMSIAQVERLTEVVFAALRSQECIQRLLCEAGAMSKSFSDTAHSVARAVEQFVPESVRDSYDIFAKAEKCEQYTCGSLQVK